MANSCASIIGVVSRGGQFLRVCVCVWPSSFDAVVFSEF